jgi:hypothetical protein
MEVLAGYLINLIYNHMEDEHPEEPQPIQEEPSHDPSPQAE